MSNKFSPLTTHHSPLTMKVKICGIKNFETAQAAIEAGATHIGLNFYPKSPRYVTPAKAAELSFLLKDKIKLVAVVVDPTDELLNEITSVVHLDYIQLHGSETPERALEIKNKFGKKIIKAISVKEAADISAADKYSGIADYILFDAKPVSASQMPGGNALSFDWEILRHFTPIYKWVLSGGLNPSNIRQAIDITGANFVDVSSGVETQPGIKSIDLIRYFLINASKR